MKKLSLCFLAVLLSACATTQSPQKDTSAFTTAAPRSILIAPVVNKSLDVDASNYVLSTLPVPMAERGYYIFPVNTSKFLLEQEGYYESEQVHGLPSETLAGLFGADAILYVTINRWDAQYILFSTTVTVDFSYRLVGRDGTELWRGEKQMRYTPQNSGGGLLSALINAAIERAAPNYLPLTREANNAVFTGQNGFLDGPYLPIKP